MAHKLRLKHFGLIGKTPVALLITLIVAILLLKDQRSYEQIENL